MKILIFVGLGGFLGSVCRYLIKHFFQYGTASFPYSTLIINFLGCFIIGIIAALIHKYDLFSNETRHFLITGFCGGFTTFSAFSHENFILLKAGNYQSFLIYTFSSIILCIAATFGGYFLFKQ